MPSLSGIRKKSVQILHLTHKIKQQRSQAELISGGSDIGNGKDAEVDQVQSNSIYPAINMHSYKDIGCNDIHSKGSCQMDEQRLPPRSIATHENKGGCDLEQDTIENGKYNGELIAATCGEDSQDMHRHNVHEHPAATVLLLITSNPTGEVADQQDMLRCGSNPPTGTFY
jgi:hypothetical protein